MQFDFKTIFDLVKAFPDEKSCHQYIAGIRWQGYMCCPRKDCDGDECYIFSDGIRYKCKKCKVQYTARTGTIFEGSNIPLVKWFLAMYLITHKRGISSVQLSKDLGVTQKTGWFVLQRLRKVLGNEKIEKLQGIVELDESYVGGKNKNRHRDKKATYGRGRSFQDKTPVFGMLERNGKVLAVALPSSARKFIKPLIYQCIHVGTTLMTDEFNVYKGLHHDYYREQVNHGKGQYTKDNCWTNGLENFWSQLKRGIIGIYVQVSKKHLNKYLHEFVFRYNYRHLSVQEQINTMLGFIECRLKYKDLIA